MFKNLLYGLCVAMILAGCADMGNGEYKMNNNTIAEFFKTGNFMSDRSVALRSGGSGGSGNSSIAGVYKGNDGSITISEVSTSQIREMASFNSGIYFPGVVWEETYKDGKYDKNYQPKQMNLGPIYAITINLETCPGAHINHQLAEYKEDSFTEMDVKENTLTFMLKFEDQNTLWLDFPMATYRSVKGHCYIEDPRFTKVQ